MYVKNIPDIRWQISDKSKKNSTDKLERSPMESGDTPVPWGTSRITKTQTQLHCFHMAQCSWTNPPNHSSVQCLRLRLALEHSACLSPSQRAPGHVQSSGQGLTTSVPPEPNSATSHKRLSSCKVCFFQITWTHNMIVIESLKWLTSKTSPTPEARTHRCRNWFVLHSPHRIHRKLPGHPTSQVRNEWSA